MTTRDFRRELEGVRCWDRHTEKIFELTGTPVDDCVLQNREELIGLCEFIEAERIRSFVEIGTWTGRLISTLHNLFDFEPLGVCDLGWATQIGLPLRLPFGASFLKGSSHSERYIAWRQELGPVDLVFIDGDHSYDAVRRDFEINRALPHRWLAFHDIMGGAPGTDGVARLWSELSGDKREIVRPHLELGRDRSTMGIGLWREAVSGR